MFHIHLARLLFERDMNQAELARRTKIRKSTITMYYYGYIQRINVKDLIKICDCLGCSLSELLEYNPNKK